MKKNIRLFTDDGESGSIDGDEDDYSDNPTNNGPLINFRLGSDAEVLLISTN